MANLVEDGIKYADLDDRPVSDGVGQLAQRVHDLRISSDESMTFPHLPCAVIAADVTDTGMSGVFRRMETLNFASARIWLAVGSVSHEKRAFYESELCNVEILFEGVNISATDS